MIILLFVIHVLIAVALVGVVLLQKSEGGALGMGGGGGGMSGFMTGRSTANLLTRTTAILAAVFMATSILLVLLNSPTKGPPRSFIDEGPGPNTPLIPSPSSNSGGQSPAAPPASAPAAPAEPSAPLAR